MKGDFGSGVDRQNLFTGERCLSIGLDGLRMLAGKDQTLREDKYGTSRD